MEFARYCFKMKKVEKRRENKASATKKANAAGLLAAPLLSRKVGACARMGLSMGPRPHAFTFAKCTFQKICPNLYFSPLKR